jgi:hypothetical protein
MTPNVKYTNKALVKKKYVKRIIKYRTRRTAFKLIIIIRHSIYGYKRRDKINGLKI